MTSTDELGFLEKRLIELAVMFTFGGLIAVAYTLSHHVVMVDGQIGILNWSSFAFPGIVMGLACLSLIGVMIIEYQK